MNNNIMKQLASYTKGFSDARIEVLGSFKLNKPIEFNEDNLSKIDDIWYVYGYRDGFRHYGTMIANNSNGYIDEDSNKIIKKSFAEQVLKIYKN